MGTLLGARLTQAGPPVDLIDVNREHVDALDTAGARVTGTFELEVPVRALMPDQLDKAYDPMFLLVKSDTVVRIVEGIEAGLYRPRPENLDLFDLVTPRSPMS